MLSGFCFYQGLTVPRLDSKPIEQFRLAERMAGRNPLLSEDQRNIPDPDPETWRQVVLRMSKSGADQLDMELLVPPEWLQWHRPEPGGVVEMDLFELGAVGTAEVLEVGPCPPIPPGPGAVITGRFIHRAAETIDLHLEGGGTIGVTPNHPIWSEDRQDYVPAGELRVGEHLLARDGRPVPITSITPRAGPETVYNLQVHGENVYQVGAAGVLVHNNKVPTAPRGGAFDLSNSVGAAKRLPDRLPPHAGSRTGKAGLEDIFRRLEKNHGIDRNLASNRLHDIKAEFGYAPDADLLFDLTGNVYDPITREWIGSLTEGGAKGLLP